MKHFLFGFALAIAALFNVPAHPQGLQTNNVIETINVTGGSINSCIIPPNTEYNIYISWLRFQYVATATVGTRVPTLRVQDAAGLALARIPFQGTGISTAGTSIFYYAYENAQTAVSGGTGQINVPEYFVIPRGGCVQVADSAAIDVADTVNQIVVVYTQ